MKYHSTIYKLTHADFPDQCYIGSTVQKLERRLTCNKNYPFDVKTCNKEILEEFDCDTLKEKQIREQHFLNLHPNNLNKMRAHRTKEQKQEDENRNHRTMYQKNKEKQQERSREIYKNPERVEYMKEYTKQYKEKAKLKKYTCDCGSTLRHDIKHRHIKTKKHLDFLASLT